MLFPNNSGGHNQRVAAPREVGENPYWSPLEGLFYLEKSDVHCHGPINFWGMFGLFHLICQTGEFGNGLFEEPG